MRMICGVKYEWVEPLLNRRQGLDVNRLLGKNIRDVLQSLQPDANSNISSTDTKTTIANQKELEEKFARRNNDNALQSARDRYLQRKTGKK